MTHSSTESLVPANASIGDHAKLTATLAEEGYLFVRNLIDPKKISPLRDAIRQLLVANDFVVNDPEFQLKSTGKFPESDELTPVGRIGRKISELPLLQQVIHADELNEFLEVLFAGKVFSWVENADRVRIMFQGDGSASTGGQQFEYATPAHQDGYHFRVNFVTCWIPLMDIDLATGGLALRKNSHKNGIHQHWFHGAHYLGIAANACQAEDFAKIGGVPVAGDVAPNDSLKTWLRSNYQAGDVLIFHPHMIHRGFPNQSPQLRLSADFRYQRQGDPTVWQADCRLFECHEYLERARKHLNQMDIKQSLADRAWEQMRRFGPNSEMQLPAQAQKIVEEILQSS